MGPERPEMVWVYLRRKQIELFCGVIVSILQGANRTIALVKITGTGNVLEVALRDRNNPVGSQRELYFREGKDFPLVGRPGDLGLKEGIAVCVGQPQYSGEKRVSPVIRQSDYNRIACHINQQRSTAPLKKHDHIWPEPPPKKG